MNSTNIDTNGWVEPNGGMADGEVPSHNSKEHQDDESSENEADGPSRFTNNLVNAALNRLKH